MKIEIFTSPTCPHCPRAYEFLKEFVKGKNIEFVPINIRSQEGYELAHQLGINSVPTIMVSSENHPERIGFRGLPSKTDLEKALEMAK